jgi:hypothetical protein
MDHDRGLAVVEPTDTATVDVDGRPSPRRSRWTWIAAGVLAVAVGVGLFWFANRDGSDSTDQVEAGAAATQPAHQPFDLTTGWQRDEAPFGQGASATDVVAGSDGRLLAAGWDNSARVTLWASGNGSRWDPVARVGTRPAGPGEALSLSVAGDIYFLSTADGFWRSTDGRQWEQVWVNELAHVGVVNQVVSFGGGLVAVGSEVADVDGAVNPRAWRSPDGAAWEPVEVPAPGASTIEAVAFDGTQLVAGGTGATGGLLWRSTDGVSWELAAGISDAAVFHDVAWNDGRWLAAGAARTGEPALWESPDGHQWTHVVTTGAPGTTFTDIRAGDAGFVVLAGDLAGENEPAVRVSADGRRWLPTVDQVTAHGTTSFAGGFVAVGADAWIWSPETDPAQIPPTAAPTDPARPFPPAEPGAVPFTPLGQPLPDLGAFVPTNETERAVVDAVYRAFGGGPYPLPSRDGFENSQELDEAFDDALDAYPEHDRGISAIVYEVGMLSDTEALVVFDIFDDGLTITATTQGSVVFVDGEWVVAQATVCEIMSRARLRCP